MVVLLILTISRIHNHFPIFQVFRPGLTLAGAAIALAILSPQYLSKTWFRRWPARVVAGLALAAVLSAIFGISLGAAANMFINLYTKVLIFTFLLMATMRGAEDVRLYVWGCVVSCAALAWLTLFAFDLSYDSVMQLYRVDDMYNYDANDAGVILVTGLTLSLLTMHASGRRGKIISLLVAAAIVASLTYGGSRGAFLGVVITVLGLIVSVSRVSVAKRLAVIGVMVGLLVVVAPEGYWKRMNSLTSVQTDYNWDAEFGRRQTWIRGLGYMLEYPVFGVGIGNFGRAEGTMSPCARFDECGRQGIRWVAPHNSFLEVGAELGFVGLVLWSSLVFGGMASLVRLRRRLPKRWYRGNAEQRIVYLSTIYLPVALAGFAVTSSFVSHAYYDLVYVLAALVLGVQAAADEQLRLNGAGETVATGLDERVDAVRERRRLRSR